MHRSACVVIHEVSVCCFLLEMGAVRQCCGMAWAVDFGVGQCDGMMRTVATVVAC